MNYQIIISGVGGQGVLFITRLFAEACMNDNRHVLTSETHGMAQRGGTIISHLKVGYFKSSLIRPGSADLLVALKPENLDLHYGFLKKGGMAIVNSREDLLTAHTNIAKALNADFLADQDNNYNSVNLYILGGAMALIPVCSIEKIQQQIEIRFAKKDKNIRTKAVMALERGFKTIKYV
jgi:indolepyruvate ferredoxin oxidoreductase beta subunit